MNNIDDLKPEDIIIAVTSEYKNNSFTFKTHILLRVTEKELIEQEEQENPGAEISVMLYHSLDLLIWEVMKESSDVADFMRSLFK